MLQKIFNAIQRIEDCSDSLLICFLRSRFSSVGSFPDFQDFAALTLQLLIYFGPSISGFLKTKGVCSFYLLNAVIKIVLPSVSMQSMTHLAVFKVPSLRLT